MCELDAFDARVRVAIRAAREDDLEALEWWGWHSAHRALIQGTYEAGERGEALMLVAAAGGFPIGQAWLDFARRTPEPVGCVWALRVIPGFRGCGVGARLLAACERELRRRGFGFSEVGAEKHNHAARRLYEREGYTVYGEERDERTIVLPDGSRDVLCTDQWLLRKAIA